MVFGVLLIIYRVMDPFAMYITNTDLLPPVAFPRRKKRLKQLQLELEKDVCFAWFYELT